MGSSGRQSSSTDPGTFNVKSYGAKGDGSTDDTAAINACVSAAYAAGVANGTYYANVHFPPGVYITSSATTKGGSTQGNAQIPLPVVATTGQKFVLAFTGGSDASAWVHWEQTVSQKSGAVIKCTLTGQTIDGTWGAPSVIGGPTVAQGSGVYSNMRVVVDGITVMCPYNPSLVAYDFKFLAQAFVIKGAALTDAPAVGSPSITTLATNSIGMALRMPQNGNNDCAYVGDFGTQGYYYGVHVAEHFTALRLGLVYTRVGIFISTGGGSFHGASIGNLSVEVADVGIQVSGTGGSSFPLDVQMMNVESINTYDVDDSGNILRGEIGWSDINDRQPLVNSATNVRIKSYNNSYAPGNKTAPAVPATNTALKNPFWGSAAVIITGGTVTAIKVDGVTTGITSGTVVVPNGKTITLTYSVAPTWVWNLL